jgi:cardiolipin synthase (CMP-forming)
MLDTLPNQLTMARMVLIPLILLLMLLDTAWAAWLALVLFVAAALTDWLDGYLARKNAQVSSFGKVMDVIADKLLVAAVLLILVNTRAIDGLTLLPALIILLREVAVSGLREFLAEAQISIPVSKLAKWKTTSQFFALAFLVIGKYAPDAVPALGLGIACLWVAGALTLITGWDYLRANLRHMADEAKRSIH